MKNKPKIGFILSGVLFALFVIFTVIVALVDARAIGPMGSSVGLATVNAAVFDNIGASGAWYTVTEIMGYFALAVAAGFGILGLVQLVRRKKISLVDRDILLLGALYLLVAAFYVLFELVTVNFRPILIDGELEASYPSSHTMLTLCIMLTAPMVLHRLLEGKKNLLTVIDCFAILFSAVMIIGRLFSGVHWLTDIFAGALLSSALITLYYSAVWHFSEGTKKEHGED